MHANCFRNLEELQIIRLLKTEESRQQKLSEKFAGKLPPSVADQIQKHITQSRNEWESNS